MPQRKPPVPQFVSRILEEKLQRVVDSMGSAVTVRIGGQTYELVPRKQQPLPEGIKARSRRGPIGDSWWSRRFIDVLESYGMEGRLARGRNYARSGRVLSLDVLPGEVKAQVQGNRSTPYRVSLRVPKLTVREWRRVEEALTERAGYLARLLAGEMPHDIEDAFTTARTSLFPASVTDLRMRCSCPDWGDPCKHAAAVLYLLAEAMDVDPFLVFRWRGRDREALLTSLRARRSDAAGPSGQDGVPSLPTDPGTFWSSGPELDGLHARPVASPVADALPRALDPAGLTVGGDPVTVVLSGIYRRIARHAEAKARGSDVPNR